MNKKIIVCFLLLNAFLASAGCTWGAPQKPVETSLPMTVETTIKTPEPTTVTTTPASTKPGPTQTVPPQWPLSISVEKAGTYSKTIIAHFDGGKGQISVARIDVRVTRSDGTVENAVLKPLNGEVTEIEGTGGTDRVEVIVLAISGETFEVIDQEMPYKTRG